MSVLQPENGALVTVGVLHGLGRGEKIYSVRFAGDLGYVVTFNQTDPLYVVDLSNPEQPVLAGQVSLSGYSSFLQPLTGSLLLGVGQAVDQQLRTQGLQLEVFNVAQPSQPALISRQQLGNRAIPSRVRPARAPVVAACNLLVLPVDNYSGSRRPAPQMSGPGDIGSIEPTGVPLSTRQQPKRLPRDRASRYRR